MEIDNYSRMVTKMSEQMHQGFMNITKMLSDKGLSNNAPTDATQANRNAADPNGIEITIGNDASLVDERENAGFVNPVMEAVVVVAEPQEVPLPPPAPVPQRPVVELVGERVGVLAAAGTAGVISAVKETFGRDNNEMEINDELEPGEIRDNNSDLESISSASSFISARKEQQHNVPWSAEEAGNTGCMFNSFGVLWLYIIKTISMIRT